MDQLTFKEIGPNRLSGQIGPTDYQFKRGQLTNQNKRSKLNIRAKGANWLRAKGTNWLSGQNGKTDYQSKFTIKAKGTNWLSGYKEPTTYQGKMAQLRVMVKRDSTGLPLRALWANWLSGGKGSPDYQGRTCQVNISTQTDYQGKGNWL